MRYFQLGLAAILLAWAFLSIQKFDFSPRRIQVPLLEEEDPLSANSILWPTKFRFLGRGHQVFAFESEDEQYVLKFFDRQQLEDHWYAHLPFRVSKKKDRRLKERMKIYPESYRLAFEWLRKETALLVVHQGVCAHHYPTVEITDAESRTFQIDLNRVPFILQKKLHSSLPERLEIAKQEGTLVSMIDQFLAIHRQRISIQIADYDRNIRDNYGWDGTRLIYLDPARIYLDKNLTDPLLCRAEWYRVTDPIHKWLKKNVPHEVAAYDAKVEQFLDWQKSKFYKEETHASRSRYWNSENCPYSLNPHSL